MKKARRNSSRIFCALTLVVIAGLSSAPVQAQTTYTWVGGFGGNVFNSTTSNWSPAATPTTGDSLIFSSLSNNNNASPAVDANYSINSITFTGTAPHYFLGTANGSPFTLTLTGTGATNGITVNTSTVSTSVIDFNQPLGIAFGANQTWQIDGNLAIAGSVSGAFSLTKNGTGYLALSGNNSYTGGTTVNAGTLYLGQTNSSSGTITIGGSGTIAPTGGADLTLGNAITAHSGAKFGTPLNSNGGTLVLNGTVTVDSGSSTIQLGNVDVNFSNPLSAAASSALTFQGTGTGVAILGGASSNTNISSMTADNTAIAFSTVNSIPASIQASNGGYVSVANLSSGTPPGDTAVLDAITNKAAFNGILGFDTDDSASMPHTYASAINLTGFTSGNVRLGSLTGAILSGTITPAGSTYDFGGYAGSGGFLAVTSALIDHGGGLTVVSPSASGGVAQNGLGLILQGNNSFSGDISTSYSGVILDSATALPSGRNFSLGASSYMGYTNQATFTSFANFASHLTSYTATSVLGVDSHTTIAGFLAGSGSPTNQVVSDAAIDLSGFSSIYLGTITGATFNPTTLKAPSDGVLRLVNLGEISTLEFNTNLLTANGVNSLVVGMSGSDGTVVLNTTANTGIFSGGTSILGGGLRISNSDTLGSATITVAAPVGSTTPSLGGSAGAVILANNIRVGGNFFIGTGSFDDNDNFTVGTGMTLNGTISNNGTAGRLYITGPSTISGTNTYTGGTYILADTTVSSNSGLGTNFVDIGANAMLTFTSAHPSIGNLSDSGNFIGGTGTGNISLGAGVTDLSVNQTTALFYSGQISSVGAANLIKRGGNVLTLTGNNTYTGTTTINGGFLTLAGSSGKLSGTSAVTISGGSISVGDATITGVSNRINPSASLTLGGSNGGGTFNLVRGSPTTAGDQSLVSLAIGTGSSTVNNGGFASNTIPTFTLSGASPYSRSAGGYVAFFSGSLTTTFTNAPSGTGNVAGSGADAILVGATLNSGFVAAASGNLAASTSTATGTTVWTAGANMNVTGTNGTPYAAAAVNSVRFSGSTANTVTLTGTHNIASGMILNGTSGSITSTLAGGTVTGAAGTDLLVINTNNSGGLNISSVIADNTSATGLTKAGSGSVTLSGNNTYTGTTTVAGGTLNVGSANALNGTPVAIYGATLNLNGNNTSIGTLTAPGGTITLGSNTLTVNQASNTTFSGSLNGTGGALVKNGAGTLTLGATNSYTGTTTVNAGILLVNGTTSSSTFSVVSGATLGGNGTVGAVNVAAGATIGPGNTSANGLLSTGNLSLLGTTMMELGGTTRGSGGYDAINVTGNITFGGALTVAYLGVYNPISGSSYDLFNWTGSPSGTFSTLNLPSLDPGLTWDTSNLYTTGVISAVPEPSTYAAIAATMMLGFAVWRRRQLARLS